MRDFYIAETAITNAHTRADGISTISAGLGEGVEFICRFLL